MLKGHANFSWLFWWKFIFWSNFAKQSLLASQALAEDYVHFSKG